MTLAAGQVKSSDCDLPTRTRAAEIVRARKVRQLDDAWIEDETGHKCALLHRDPVNGITFLAIH